MENKDIERILKGTSDLKALQNLLDQESKCRKEIQRLNTELNTALELRIISLESALKEFIELEKNCKSVYDANRALFVVSERCMDLLEKN